MNETALGVTGDVTIAVEVDTTGVPDLATVEVLNVALEEFQTAAVQVVGQMRFSPAQRDGRAVRARTVIPIRFWIRR